MARKLIFWMVIPLHVALVQEQVFAQDAHVYFINNSGTTSLTGFRLKGKKGIITSLHGVTKGSSITAKPITGKVFTDLIVREVDIDHDLALLSNSDLDKIDADGIEIAKRP